MENPIAGPLPSLRQKRPSEIWVGLRIQPFSCHGYIRLGHRVGEHAEMKELLIIMVLILVGDLLLHFFVGPLLFLADKGLTRYRSLPEVLRWLLCWPFSLVMAILSWLAFVLPTWWWMPPLLMAILVPPLCHGVFLWCIYTTVPRARLAVLSTLIVLRSLVLVLLGIAGVAVLLGAFESSPFDAHDLPAILGEVAALVVSLVLWKHAWKMRRKEIQFACDVRRVQCAEVQADDEESPATTESPEYQVMETHT